MKRLYLLGTFFLSLMGLASCSSPKVDAKAYFDGLEVAAKGSVNADALAISCPNGNAKMGFASESGTFALDFSKMNFDLRLSGINATDPKAVRASFVPLASSGNTVKVSGTGIPTALNSFVSNSGVPAKISAYYDEAEEGTMAAYVDFSKAAVLRVGLQTAIRNLSGDESFDLATKTKFTLDQDALSKMEERLPLSNGMNEGIADLVSDMRTVYESSPDYFLFSKENEESTIVYRASSWQAMRDIAKAFDLDGKTEEAIDKLEKESVLNRLNLTFAFNADSLKSLSLDAAVTFAEKEESKDLAPVGQWTASGTIEFAKGKTPLSPSDKGKYTEFAPPELPDEE